jgi:hypothetical protein
MLAKGVNVVLPYSILLAFAFLLVILEIFLLAVGSSCKMSLH